MRIAYSSGERTSVDCRWEYAGAQPHRKLAGDARLDARLENPLGRLNFYGFINKRQYEAGQKYRSLAIEYLRAIGAPDPFNAEVYGSVLHADGSDAVTELKYKAYRRALEAAGKSARAGRHAAIAVDKIVVYEEPPILDDIEIPCLRRGLDALADAMNV